MQIKNTRLGNVWYDAQANHKWFNVNFEFYAEDIDKVFSDEPMTDHELLQLGKELIDAIRKIKLEGNSEFANSYQSI